MKALDISRYRVSPLRAELALTSWLSLQNAAAAAVGLVVCLERRSMSLALILCVFGLIYLSVALSARWGHSGSRIAFSALNTLGAIGMSVIMGVEAGVSLLLLPAALLPFNLFKSKEIGLRRLFMLLPTVGFFVLHILPQGGDLFGEPLIPSDRLLVTRIIICLSMLLDIALRMHFLESLTSSKQRALELALADAEGAASSKETFLQTMSYEIRTPLNGIQGGAQLLMSSQISPYQVGLVQTLRRTAASMAHVLKSSLLFVGGDPQNLENDDEIYSVRELLEDVVTITRAQVDSPELEISMHIEEGVPESFVGGASLVRQVITNLMTNAVKFTERGCVSVRFSRDQHPGQYRFEIRDTGRGMTEVELAKMFQLYSQANASISSRYGGTGLGLAICQRIVESQGGEIGVQSEFGEGTLFWCRWPLNPSSDSEEALPQCSLGQVQEGPRVLVAEDDPNNRLVVGRMLERLGCKVTVVSDGLEALDIISKGAGWDLVLLDLVMPHCDGFMVHEELRRRMAEGSMSRIPVAALTAYATSDVRERCAKEGFDDFLVKPFSVEALQGLVSRLATGGVSSL